MFEMGTSGTKKISQDVIIQKDTWTYSDVSCIEENDG